MDGLTLLAEARRAGLQVALDGDRLVVQGPRRLEPVALQLLAEKPRVLRALSDVAWRVAAMRPQMTRSGPIPLLLARPFASWPPGCCCSCGDPLPPTDRHRCRPCTTAAITILGALR